MKHMRLLSLAILTSASTLPLLSGCVERKITIATDPPGALVYVNDVEKGRSPVIFPFTWYGDYDLRFRYEKDIGTPEKPQIQHYYLHTNQRASAPWYQWIGIDLFAEILPFQFQDEKIWAFTIPPVPAVSDDQLIRDAKDLQNKLNEEVPLKPKAEPNK